MNKYIWLIIVMAVVIAGGVAYKIFLRPESSNPMSTGNVKEFTITATKDTWSFVPEEIDVDRGDKVVLTVINEDAYDHGIGIDAFGISQRMPANQTIKFDFVATQPGEFLFYCSVPCGDGDVPGHGHRTHFDMVGKIKVKDIVQTSTSEAEKNNINIKGGVDIKY